MDDLVKERLNWLRHQIEYYGRYHDHKETMAWVVTAFYLSGIIYLSVNIGHIPQFHYKAVPIVLTIAILLASVSIGIFLDMQFNRRAIANKYVGIFRDELTLLLDNSNGNQWAKAIEAKLRNEQEKNLKGLAKCLKGKGADSEDPYPRLSKYATYIAISSITLLAIALTWIQYCHR